MKHRRMDFLAWLAMGAAVAVSAQGEWSLAVACGFHPVVAAGLPLALDTYALRALRAGREVLLPVLGMIATNAAAHLLASGVLRPDWRLIVLVSAIAPLVLWRVHVLRAADGTEPAHTPAPEPQSPPAWAEPVSAMAEADPQPVPETSAPEPVAAEPAVPELTFMPLPTRRAPVDRAERTRPETGDGYVPAAPESTAVDQQKRPGEEDELTARAREKFAAVLADGSLPSIRTLRAEYGIGQPRAQRVQDQLRTRLAAPEPVAA